MCLILIKMSKELEQNEGVRGDLDLLPGGGGEKRGEFLDSDIGQVGGIRRFLRRKFSANYRTLEALPGLSERAKQLVDGLWPKGHGEGFKQSEKVGDCYYLAVAYLLKQASWFPYLVGETCDFWYEDGQLRGWEASFIGADEGEDLIQIDRKKDLKGQRVQLKNGKMQDRAPVEGQVGDIVLERAFGRYRKVMKSLNEKAQEEMTLKAADGGMPLEPFELLLGDLATEVHSGYYGSRTLEEQRQFIAFDAEHLLSLAALDPDQYLLAAATPVGRETDFWKWSWDPEKEKKVKRYYVDEQGKFPQQHAYAVVDIDLDAQTLVIVNPHDTAKKRHKITWKQFEENFSFLSGVRLDKRKMEERFKGFKFAEEQDLKNGIYGEALKTRERYIYAAPNKNEALRVYVGEEEFVLVVDGFASPWIQYGRENGSGRGGYFSFRMHDGLNAVIGSRRMRFLSDQQAKGTKLGPNHFKVSLLEEGGIEIVPLMDELPIKVERRQLDEKEGMFGHADPGEHNMRLPSKFGYRYYELEDGEQQLFALACEPDGRVPLVALQRRGEQLVVTAHGAGIRGQKDIATLQKGQNKVLGRDSLVDRKVSNYHLYVAYGKDGRVYVRDLSRNGTYAY